MRTNNFYFLLVSTFLLTGCLVENQKLKSSFFEEEIPSVLKSISNQSEELSNIEVSKINQRKGIRIAIIDDGIDVSHPDLISSIDYEVSESGSIVSVGKDFMGDDEVASASLIDSTLFSFSADKIEKGQIHGPLKDPLDFVLEVNDFFITDLQEKVKKEESLKGTFFFDLNFKENLSVYSVWRSVNKKKWIKGSSEDSKWDIPDNFLIDIYTQEKIEKDIKFVNELKKKKYVDGYALVLGYTELSSSEKFKTYGVSDLFYYDDFIRGASLVKDLAFESLKETLKKYNIKKSFQSLREFNLSTNKFSKMDSEEDQEEVMVDYINNILINEEFGVSFLHQSQDLYLSRLNFLKFKYSLVGYAVDLETDVFKETFSFYREALDKAIEVQETPKSLLNPDEEINLEAARVGLDEIQKLFLWFNKNNKKKLWNRSSEEEDLYKYYYDRVNSPFVDESSFRASHGTHTAGIASIQHPENRIYPIRVTTTSVYGSKKDIDDLHSSFVKTFSSWLNIRPVNLGLRALVYEKSPELKDQIKDYSNAEFTLFLTKRLASIISIDIKENSLDYIFINDIVAAIKHIGEKKIKVASISLGSEYSEGVEDVHLKHPQLQLEGLYKFLKTSYAKYKIGSSIKSYAENSLFVVATGNNGQWLDGAANNAFPVDLRSVYFSKFEEEEQVLPNNNLKNILAVGSLNSKGDLSSFTNILIGKNLPPFVLSFGENIYSPIRNLDLSFSQEIISKKFSNIQKLKNLNISKIESVYNIKAPKVETVDLLDKKRREIKQKSPWSFYGQAASTLILNLWDFLEFEVSLQFQLKRGKMSGTSMATPAVSGKIGGFIYEKMKSLSLNEDEIYEDPRFAPELILSEVVSKFSLKDAYIPFDRIIDVKQFQEDKGLSKLTNFLKSMKAN